MRRNTGLLICILVVLVAIAGLLTVHAIKGGVWVIEGLNGRDGASGKDGESGKSAYELAVEDGFEGSLHEWLLSLAIKGENGDDGAPGKDGQNGIGVRDVRISAQGYLYVTLTNGVVLNAGYIGGENDSLGEVDDGGFVSTYEMVTVTNCAALNLREGPGASYPLVDPVPAGAELLRVGENESLGSVGWSRLVYQKNGESVICYASSYYLELKYEYHGELPDVHLPEQMTVTAGEPLILQNDQIVPYLPEHMRVSYAFSGDGERIYTDAGFTVTPSAHGMETLTVSLELYDAGGWYTAYTHNVAVRVLRAEVTAGHLTGLLLGDDHVAREGYLAALTEACPELTLIGTRSTGRLSHEGGYGWSAADYLHSSVDNPFYNPTAGTFDFAYYMQQNGYTALDFVVISLGDGDGYGRDAAMDVADIVESIEAYDGDIQVIILPPALSPDKRYQLTGFSSALEINVGKTRADQFLFLDHLQRALGGREEEGIVILYDHLSINADTDRRCDGGYVIDLFALSDTGYEKRARALVAHLRGVFGAVG